jgi:arabinofuranosyltransferase
MGTSIQKLIASVVLLGTHCVIAIDRINYRIDDVYISLRYVYNVLHGAGMVFNPGQRLEAISNPTWVWLIAAVSGATGATDQYGIIAVAKVMGVVLQCAAIVVFFLLLLRVSNAVWFAFIFALAYGVNPFVATYSIGGLENPLVNLLLMLWLYWYAEYARLSQARQFILCCVALGFLSISRPEGVIYPAAFFASLLILSRNELPKRFWAGVSITAGIFVAMLLWRVSYYDSWVPNTVYAKNSPSPSTFAGGFKYVLMFAALTLLPYMALILTKRDGWGAFPPSVQKTVRAAACIIAAQVAFVIYAGGDWMVGYRLLLIVLPLILFVIAVYALPLVERQGDARWSVMGVLIFSIILVLMLGRENMKMIQPHDSGLTSPWKYVPEWYIEMADQLKAKAPPGSKVLVSELGVVPLLAPDYFYMDVSGLADAHVARNLKGAHFNRNDPEYYAHLDFDYFIPMAPSIHYQEAGGQYVSGRIQLDQVFQRPGFAQEYSLLYENGSGMLFGLTTSKHTP